MAVKEIVTTLKLDGKNFDKGLSGATGNILKFSAAATTVQAAIGAITKIAANFQDNMIKSARIAGTTAESFSGLSLAAEQSGMEINQFRDALSKFQEAGPKEALKKIGIATKDINGNARDSVAIFKDFAEHISKIENPAERTSEAMKVFGGEGARMINILSADKDGLEALEEKAKSFGLVVSTEAGQAAEKFNDNINDISQATKGLTNTIGESLIAFANQSSILDDIEKVITSVTSYWRQLDDSTKEFIITTVSLVSGIGVAIGTITLLTLAAKTFFAVMLANPIVLVITAIIGAVVLLANEIRKNWDQMQNIIEPLSDSFEDLKNQIGDIADDVTDTIDNIADFGKGAEKSGKQIDVLGTIAKNVFSAITTALILIINNISNMISIAKLTGKTFYNLGKIIIGALTFNRKKIVAGWKQLKKDITDNITDIVSRSIAAGERIGKIWSKPIIYKADIKEIDKVNKKLGELGDKTEETLTKSEKDFLKWAEKVDKVLKKVQARIAVMQAGIGEIGNIVGYMAEGISRTADEAIIKMQVINAKAVELYEKTKEAMQKAQDEELEYLTDNYDAQIQALKDMEDEKQAIIENAILKRQLALDEEFQAEKARMEAEFEAYVKSERAKFEAKKEILDEEAADNEQRKFINSMLENDYNLWLEDEKARFEESLTNLAKTYSDKRTENDKIAKTKQEGQARQTAKKIQKLEKRKDDAITRTTEKFLTEMQALDENEEKRSSKARREQTRAEWNRDLSVYKQTRAVKIAAAIATGAASSVQAYAQSVAAFAPTPAGVPIGKALVALIAGATALQIHTINKSKPRKPAELRMQTGGVAFGPSHAAGGVSIEAEGGEGFLDVTRTKKFLNIADNMINRFDEKSSGKIININFMERSLIVNDINAMIPEVVDKINRELAEDVRRRVAV